MKYLGASHHQSFDEASHEAANYEANTMYNLGIRPEDETTMEATAPDVWAEKNTAPLIRENNCIVLCKLLEQNDGISWAYEDIARQASMPPATLRRLSNPHVPEHHTVDWLVGLRRRHASRTGRDLSAGDLVTSYYGHILDSVVYEANPTLGECVWVNTSQFPLFQRVGASIDFSVTFDPRVGIGGRARARYVGPTFRWSSEDRFDRGGYRTRWA